MLNLRWEEKGVIMEMRGNLSKINVKYFLRFFICWMLVVAMASCGQKDLQFESEQVENSNVSTEALFFASGVNSEMFLKYMMENGQKSEDSTGNIYYLSAEKDRAVAKNESYLSYNPTTKVVRIIATTKQQTTLSDIVYQYTYTGIINLKFRDSLNHAEFTGIYEQQSAMLTGASSAYYTATINFSIEEMESGTEMADFSKIKYSSAITNASNYQKANEHFNKKEVAEKCYSKLQVGINYVNEIFKKIDSNYSFSGDLLLQKDCTHIATTKEGMTPTCTKDGLSEEIYCPICDKVISNQKTIAATGHKEVIDTGHDSTCTKKGLTNGTHCSVCGEILKAQIEIEKKEHNYFDGICTTCGKQKPSDGLQYSETYYPNYGYSVSKGTCADSQIIINEEISDIPVVAIATETFKNDLTISKVVIPKSITVIGWDAFYGCENLKEIVYLGTIDDWKKINLMGGKWYRIGANEVKCVDGNIAIKVVYESYNYH